MASPPEIYLHIGHAKVASSTIQSFLRTNADEIRRQGYLIADRGMQFPQGGPVREDPNRILREWLEESEHRSVPLGDALRPVHAWCEREGCRGAIISSEFLGRPNVADWFRRSAGDISLRVLLYIRRQEDWLESAWKQWALKRELSLDKYLEHNIASVHPRFLETAVAWKEAADDLIVRPIEGVENVQSHFANWCGLDFDRLKTVEPANQTFDWALLDLLSRSPHLFTDSNDNRIFDFLNGVLPEGAPRKGHGLMTLEMSERIHAAFENENRELRRQFFPDLPACDWDRAKAAKEINGRMDDFGSAESLYRNLSFQLMIAWSLFHRIQSGGPKVKALEANLEALDARTERIGGSITRRFDRLRARLQREETRREALEKRVEQLESRSLWNLVSRPFTRSKARRQMPEDDG